MEISGKNIKKENLKFTHVDEYARASNITVFHKARNLNR